MNLEDELLDAKNAANYLGYANLIAFKALQKHYVKTLSSLTGNSEELILSELQEMQNEAKKEIDAGYAALKEENKGSN